MTTPVRVAACGVASAWGSWWQWKDVRAACYFTVTANGSWPFLILILQRSFFLLTCDCQCRSNIILDPLLREAFGKGGVKWEGGEASSPSPGLRGTQRSSAVMFFLPLLLAVQQDKDTKCMPCPRGYFSKVASSTDECKAWTK